MAYDVSICTTDYLQCLILAAGSTESHTGYLDHEGLGSAQQGLLNQTSHGPGIFGLPVKGKELDA
jgi:hypothetical protein